MVASLEAARDAKAPIILQMSQGGAAYFAGKVYIYQCVHRSQSLTFRDRVLPMASKKPPLLVVSLALTLSDPLPQRTVFP